MSTSFGRLRIVPILRRWARIGTVASSLFLCGSAWADTFTVGIVPQFEPRMLVEIWAPILSELEHRTGHQFQLVASPQIPDFEQALLQGAFDFAYMNPYHFVIASAAQGYTPVVNDAGRELFGILVVAAHSDIHTVSDLEGGTIAFPAPNALGAALLMRSDLDRIFGLSYEAHYVGTHSSAYLNVILGRMDAAGGVRATLDANPAYRNSLRIIHETTRLPTHPFAAHGRIAADTVAAVAAAFLAMNTTEDGQAMLARVPFDHVAPANTAQYDILKELNLKTYWIE